MGLLIYNSTTVNDLLYDIDSKISTYLSNKTLVQLHKEFVYWTSFPPDEVFHEHLSPLKSIDRKIALNGIRFVEQKSTENFQVADQEHITHDVYERFGFGKHHGRLITFVIRIEYNEPSLDRGFFTTIVSNGLKKCNSVIDAATSLVDKGAELLSMAFHGYKVQLMKDDHDEL